MSIWDNVDALYKTHLSGHKSKLSDLRSDTHFEFEAVWKKLPGSPKTPAVAAKIINDTSGSVHYVCMAVNPATGKVSLWCGDTNAANVHGEKESRCEFWGKTTDGNSDTYMCKHGILVAQEMIETPSIRKGIEAKIAKAAQKTVSGVSCDVRVSQALELWRPTLLFGPTGSGKTHRVRELMKIHPEYRWCKINITNGLEDIDTMQKLLPKPDGAGWQQVDGELRKVFLSAREAPTVLQLEELTRSCKSLRNLLVKVLDPEDGKYCLHDIARGEVIEVPRENLMVFATANLGYSDTSELDPALARRFSFSIFVDYDVAAEKKALEKLVDKKTASWMVKIAAQIRDQFRNGVLPAPLDTGSLLEWGNAIKCGLARGAAAELTWLYRVVEKDGLGYPEPGQLEALSELLAEA